MLPKDYSYTCDGLVSLDECLKTLVRYDQSVIFSNDVNIKIIIKKTSNEKKGDHQIKN